MEPIISPISLYPYHFYNILLRDHPLHTFEGYYDNLFIRYYYIVHPKRWWIPFRKERFEIVLDVINDDIVIRRWNSFKPSRLINYFENFSYTCIDWADYRYLCNYFQELVMLSYYHGISHGEK